MTVNFSGFPHALKVRAVCELAYLVDIQECSVSEANNLYASIEYYIDNLTPIEIEKLGRGHYSIVVAIVRKSERIKLMYSKDSANSLLIIWTNRFYTTNKSPLVGSPVDDLMVRAIRYSNTV